MKRTFCLFAALYLFPFTVFCQAPGSSAGDFDFEESKDKKPAAWTTFGDIHYDYSLDSASAQHGKQSLRIAYEGEADGFGAWSYTLPAMYAGKSVTLRGYLKTENVRNGWAGFWMRHDPDGPFDNMQKRGIKGSTGWTEYEVTLPLTPGKTEKIVIGCLLAGQGKMWIDNLHVSIDSKDISEAPLYTREEKPADKDREFENGSGITSIPSDAQTVENLRVLGLVWGFLKYYHPGVRAGNVNWDNELFRILPRIIAQPGQRDALISGWIDKLGPVDPGKAPKTKDEITIRPDLDWIEQSGLSPELAGQLQRIQKAKRDEKNHYVSFAPGVGNPEFKNEIPYDRTEYPDAGTRLLALYRYWNMIQYYFPYKDLIEEDWKGVLKEFIPRVLQAGDETAYQLSMLELIGRVHDSHADIWSRHEAMRTYFGLNRPSVEIRFAENKPMVIGHYSDSETGNPLPASGLLKGDILTSIGGRPVDALIQEKLKHNPGSNYPTQLRNMAPYLLRTNDSTLRVGYLRNGVAAEAVLETYPANRVNIYSKFQRKDSCFKLLRPDIGYMYPGSIKNSYLPGIQKELEKTKGLIIDLRCYPSEFIVFTMGAYLLPEGKPFVKFSQGDPQLPGRFMMSQPLVVGDKNPQSYKGRVVILIDETTQSQAEYTTMALRTAPGATVIGSTTAGADGNVSRIRLPGKINTLISGIGVFYPNGRGTQRVGIVPDIELRPTIKGLTEGRDELIERAISVIDGK